MGTDIIAGTGFGLFTTDTVIHLVLHYLVVLSMIRLTPILAYLTGVCARLVSLPQSLKQGFEAMKRNSKLKIT